MAQRLLNLITNIDLTTEICCKCGVLFAMPTEMCDRFLREGGCFYCPNGHSQHYIETKEMKLRHQLDQQEAELLKTNERLNGALREVTNKKRQLTRLQNRVRNGVCIECHRHFSDLEEHMKTCHSKPQ